MESVIDPENPQSIHHKIAYFLPEREGQEEGVTSERHVLKVGDDVLQVNERVLVGLSHSEAVEVLQDTPPPITVVISRRKGVESGAGPEEGIDFEADSKASTLVRVDISHAPSGPSSQRPQPANIDFLLDNFSRRFERQSWRIRHEEERRRLKQKFEVSTISAVQCRLSIKEP